MRAVDLIAERGQPVLYEEGLEGFSVLSELIFYRGQQCVDLDVSLTGFRGIEPMTGRECKQISICHLEPAPGHFEQCHPVASYVYQRVDISIFPSPSLLHLLGCSRVIAAWVGLEDRMCAERPHCTERCLYHRETHCHAGCCHHRSAEFFALSTPFGRCSKPDRAGQCRDRTDRAQPRSPVRFAEVIGPADQDQVGHEPGDEQHAEHDRIIQPLQ